ncbi:PREDICTED: ATP-binding cassette sub-family A member 13 [Calidris pugnax]|uniref:ATP-binding cassette sub-family A member 13 n=1 Tax=Calidris pugnax TaxID=198806 RepID=UPI00071CFCCE|nr:PREDICTED: ATP-binding cassette sub-family A member 13 [Calidris pugnax]
MGHAVHQFKALFWKNWLCRVRQPVLSLTEILWPCVLFLILAAIRFQEPPKYKENCYLEARDLPSRGLYPFMRTLFCNVGSRCKNTSYTRQKTNRLQRLHLSSRAARGRAVAMKVSKVSNVGLNCGSNRALIDLPQTGTDGKERHEWQLADIAPALEIPLNNSGIQAGTESFTGPDLGFMKEVEELAKGFIETTEKTMALEKLWEENSKFSVNMMDLNEVEEMISKAENLYKQPYFWNLLHSLPRLELNSLYTEDGLAAIAQFLKVIQNTLASLKDLAMMPLGKSFYEMVKTALNLTAASIEERSLEGFQYNLTLGDILWNPHAVRSELEFRFGFDDLHVKKLLNYTVKLTKIPTGETLEQFVCSALSSVQEDEANKENNEGGCISAWHEAKMYLVHAVSKLRLYAQVFEQWFSSSFSQKLLLELDDLMSQFLDDREARKIFSEINTLIQRWNEKSNAYFSEGYTAPHDLILHLERMQSVLQDIPQWPVMKRLLQVDGAIRNIIAQYLYFTEETLRSLEKEIPFAQRDGFIHLDIRKLFVELKQMLMSNASYICSDVLKMLEKTLRLPQGSDDIDISAIYMCPDNGSEVTFKLSDQVQSLKESVLLLQKVTQGQQNLPASRMDDYLGWQEIEEQLTKNYAYYCEINQLLSTEAPSEEDVHFTSCQEQLLFSLINSTLEDILFAFEGNPYWKDLTTFVSWTCEVAQHMNEEAGSTGDQSDIKIIVFSYQLVNWNGLAMDNFDFKSLQNSQKIGVWHDLQDRDRVFDFLSESFELLWNFTSRSMCEKLLIIYNYTEFQAQSLAQKGKKEMQVVYSTLSSLKTLFIDEEFQTAAICYLEEFLDISPECLVNNGCIDFYPSNITSVNHSAEVYSLLLLPLDSVLSNITNLGDKVSAPSALHCTFTWLQTWTEIFEEASKILHLNSTFFVCLRNDLANLSESLLNVTNDELCNNTAMVVGATTAAMNLLKIISQGGGDLNDWKDFEASLANLQSIFINAVDVTSSLKGNSLESVLDTMEVMITELQKSILKVANGEFLNSWLDTFISGRFQGEDKGADVFSIGNSLSTILKLSQKELGIILTEIKDTTAFFESIPQVELLAEIQTLLKNKTSEMHENSSFHLDIEIEPFLHEKNTSFLMEFFQYVISKLDSDLQDEQKTFLQELIETAALNIELVRKALEIFKSSHFTGFPLRDDKEFLKHMVDLVQNMRNMDVEFLISQFKQVQESLDNFFNSIKPLYIEMSELGMLTKLWDAFDNNSCNGNLTGLWQITRVFKQDEIDDVEEMFKLLFDVISLMERLAHGNITEALIEVYTFILTHEAKMPMFTEEEFSNQVESLLMLLETLTDMSDEPAESSICFSASFCWTLTTATPQSDPTSKPCDFVYSNSTLSYNAVIEVIKELKLITLEDISSCTMEDFQTEITHNLTCFFHQIKEWNSILLKFSELHHVNDSVLKELQDFWDELSAYAVPLQVNSTYSINCSSTLKKQVAFQIVETLANMPVAEMEMAKGVLEQLRDLYGDLTWNRHSRTSFIKTVLTNFKNMTSEVSGLLDTEAVLSLFSVIQPIMTLSSVGNHTYSILMTLAALNGNSNISDNFENFWFPIVTSIEDLLVNFNVRHALVLLDQEFQLLRLATGQSSSIDLGDLIQQFNTSSVDATLRNLEDIEEILNSFLCECNNKNYSKIMHTIILLMANEDSLNDLLLFVKDIIDVLELFQNKSKEDYTGMLFVDGHLSREKLNNTHTANSDLLKSLFHIITDLSVIEEALHTNNTELQIGDFFDSFFDNAQYREVSTQSQNRTMEIMQEILQMVFQSTTEHDRNKITFSLKDLHKDIMAEMRVSKICKILQKHLYPASFLLLQKLQFTILNVLKIFSEEPVVIGNLFCATSCKDGLMSHVVLSVIEGITLVQDHYQDIERMWPSFNKGDCESVANVNQKLSSTLESFLTALQNTSTGSCVKVKECVQNLTQLRLGIGSSVNISEETVSTILESSISHSKVFYSAFLVALTGRCDEELLSLLLKLPENSKTSLVVEELCSLTALDMYTMFVMIMQNLNVRHIFYKVKIPSEIGNVLNMLLDVVSSISSLLDKAHHIMENLPVFLQGIQDIGVLDISALWQFLQGGQFRSSAVGSLESVIKAVCKEESSFFSNANLFIDMPRIMGLLEDNMAKYGIPEDSSPFCLKLYQEILQSSNGALLWTFLKPLLHGKILYNSNINMIDLVMEKANFTFGFVENLKTYSETWLRMSEVFKTSGNVLKVSQLQEALQSNFIKHFIESNLDIDMEKLLKKMQVYETMMNKMLSSSASKQIDLLSQLVVNISSCVLLDRFQPFDSVEKLEEKAHELMQQNNFLASIIFDMPKNKTQDSSKLLPRHISYTIRTSVLYSMRTDLIKNPAWKSHPQKLPADGFKYNHIFIPLQDMIERAIISAQTGTDTLVPAIQVQAMPYPCHTSDLFLNNIGFFFPLMMMLTWMVSVAGMVRKLVYEREIHLEEYMKTMGVHPAIHFFAWFLENVIVLTISSCALAIILKASGIFAYSNGFLVFLFLLDFGVTVIMLSYFLGAFFSSADTAALCASLVYMISFLPYIVLLVLQNQLSFISQVIMCLLSTTAFGQGVFFITFFEGQEIGIQWNNVHQSVAQGGHMTFGWMCWMMLFDSILYSIGGWYFGNIIPGKFGLKNRWYFPFTLSYWKNLCGAERRKRHYLNSNMFFFNESFQEKDPAPPGWKGPCMEGATIGVVLLSLTKEHVDGQKAAVKDLSLTFHRGQITALLGPNGAGKTTVISLLTGQYPPSSGTIIVNGKDIRTDLAAIRTELGVCPQYDVLFNILTVREHLLLYGSVKAPGWTKEQLNQYVSGALEDVDLSQHQYKPVGALSGGLKRRLSIAISFIGNSKTVVLDEPTSGVDPCSRRSIWDVLLKYKAGCTLIFTTHHLDEAEVLSDRIAILQRGQLRCCGSPSYLRETYGQGHSLTLIKKPSMFEIQDPKHIFRVTSLVQTHIPEAFLKENNGTELTYVIPEGADKTSFKGLFQALDQSLHHLHVTGYGISDTTLEEVFLIFLHNGIFLYVSLTGASSVHGAHLILAQIVALLMKRFYHFRRDWRGSLSNVLLPVFFVALAMALFSVKPLAIDYPSLKLTPRLYDNAESFFSTEDDNLGNLSQILLRYFSDWDNTCMHSKQGFNTSAPYMKNKKGHILYNLSGFLVEEYLVRPSNKARYGGWSFGGRKAFELQDEKLNNTKSKPLVKVWYNQKAFHSLPSYLNELNNFILWLNLPPDVDWRQYGITLYSQPYGGALLDEDKIMENVRQCGVALCIMLGFSILTASIGSAVVRDRVSGTKRLQHITGLGYTTYWLANFCCDMLFYMVPVTLCVGVISAFQLSAFTFRKNLAATVLLLILFGYATLPWMYLVSRFFSSSDVAFISYISLNFVFGLCTMLVTLLPRLLAIISKVQSFQNIYNILKWAFIVFPQFCLGQGLIELSYNQIKFDLTSNFGIDSYVSPFEMNFLGWIFVEMALQGTLLLLLRLFLHWDLLQKARGQCSINSMVSPSEDVDVEMERQRLFGGRTGNDVLLLYNLRKCYGGFSKKNTAVESISLGIPRGECFGLLGTNGAGKSTTFKMLTGDITPSAGRAVIRTPTGSEMDILSASSEGILIGYCPQQDALDELLTGWEHLHYYCTLRGIPKQDIRKVAEDLVNRLHLNAHADKLVRTYSAGTKRKLSTAVALVGKPQILLLDEPSSGMDPCSKRYLWKTILKEVQDGCAAVLTSHSMEECEALCTRLAIMVNGSFKCLGSPQHIKNRFGDGYSVKVWLSKEVSYQRMILDRLQLHFPGTQFKGQHLNLLEYHVPRSQGCLAELFRVLENHKAFLQIKHYSISQTTLEQVFINFATQQQGVSHSSQESPVHHDHLPV